MKIRFLKLIINIFFSFIGFFLLPSVIYAYDACNTSCLDRTGDADLGVNFTGLQPDNIDPDNPAKRITVTLTAVDTPPSSVTCSRNTANYCACDYPAVGGEPSGTAGYTASCNAYNNSGNIECQVRHLDCRNKPFNITIFKPTGYTCAVTGEPDGVLDGRVDLNNCSNNGWLTINCSAPTSVISSVACKVYNGNTTTDTCLSSGSTSGVTVNTGNTVTWCVSRSGGTGTYSYSWSSNDSLSGTTQSVTKTYSTSGSKTASVTVSSGTATPVIASCPTVTVNAACTCSSTDDANYCSGFSYTNSCSASCTGSKTCSSGYTCSTAATPHSCVVTTTPNCTLDDSRIVRQVSTATGCTAGSDVSGNATINNTTFQRIRWKVNNGYINDAAPATTNPREITCVGYGNNVYLQADIYRNSSDDTPVTTCNISFSNPAPGQVNRYKCNGDACQIDNINGTFTSSNCGNSCAKPPGDLTWENSPDISCQGQNGTATANITLDWITTDTTTWWYNLWRQISPIENHTYCLNGIWHPLCDNDEFHKDTTRWTNYGLNIYKDGNDYNNPLSYYYSIEAMNFNKQYVKDASDNILSVSTNWLRLKSYCPPDLIIEDITANSYNFVLGNSTTIREKVKNIGWGARADWSDTKFCTDRTDKNCTAVSTSYTDPLPVNQISAEGTWTFTPTLAGNYTVTACADGKYYSATNPIGRINEVNENNNCKTTGVITVTPRPVDLDPGDITISPAGAISPGTPVTFSVDVTNTGTGNAGSFNSHFCLDVGTEANCYGTLPSTSLVSYDILRTIGAGLTNTYRSTDQPRIGGPISSHSPWTATSGDHTVYFCADTDRIITETNASGTGETNNCSSKTFTVIAPYQPWIQVDGDVHSNTKIDLSGGPP